MKRNLTALSDSTFDVAIVGAGIYGAAIAWDASLRGLSVALIDKGDFCGATSANSLKTIHGGLRYLQNLDVKRMRESIRERRTYLSIAPHLVHPLTCVMPTYGHAMKGIEALFAGLLLNDVISFDRNRLDDPQKRIPSGRIVSKSTCLKRIPGISGDRITGGAEWTDAQVYNSERFVLAMIQSAAAKGAVAANYVACRSLIRQGGRVTGVRAEDALTGDTFAIRAKLVVNAAGGWIDQVLSENGKPSSELMLSTAMNLVVERTLLPGGAAGFSAPFVHTREDGSQHRGSRVLFASNWRGHTIVGTFHKLYDGSPDDLTVSEAEVQQALDEINGAWIHDPIQLDEVTFVQKGLLPAAGIHPKTGEVNLAKHYRIIDHARDNGPQGLLSVVGVKYTTARDVAEKVVNLVFRKMGKTPPSCATSATRLAGGEIARFDAFFSEVLQTNSHGLGPDVLRHLALTYGSDYPRILTYGSSDPALLKLVPGSNEVIRAEVVHAVRNESAQTLADVIFRRTDLGSARCPPDETLSFCAESMSRELGWKPGRVSEEINTVKSRYRIVC